MKLIVITLMTLLSFTAQASSFDFCKNKIMTQVEAQILSSGGQLESSEGESQKSIKWMGDGFFDVSYTVWNKDPQVLPVVNEYEAVVGAECEIIYIDLIK